MAAGSNPNLVNKDLLKRYFDNACTPEEREKVALWLSDPGHREEVLLYMDGEWDQWVPSAEALAEATKEADLSFNTLFRQVRNAEERSSGKVLSLFGRKSRMFRIISGVAASLLFLLAGAWIGYYYHGKALSEGKAPVYYATAQTLRGQRSRLVLSDGSEVYLNAESRLSFSNEASAHQVVYLEGEAYFKVPNKDRRLIVKTKDLVASTRGSQFNISAFPKDSTVTVSVENGRTEISRNNEKTFPLTALRIPGRDSVVLKDSTVGNPKPKLMPMMAIRPIVVLKANEAVTYDKNNKLTSTPARLNEEELSSWKDGFIYFNHTDSAALVDKLERWFDVDVSLNMNGVPLKPLNCGFRNATLHQVLAHIGNELNLDYRVEGRHVFLNRRSK